MNLLFIYHRDIHQDDSGASRTIILRENYLVTRENINVYTSFHHLSPVDERINEIKVPKLSYNSIKTCILEYNIDILCVPEGELLAKMAHKAVRGTKCKIVTEFHNMPGYNFHVIKANLKKEIATSGNVLHKINGIIKANLFSIFRSYICKKYREAYKYADKFVVLSTSFYEQYRQIYRIPNVHKMVAIGNPLSFKENIAFRNIEAKENTLLVVARLEENSKRISLILKAWSMLKDYQSDWNLKIVGSGNDDGYYKKMAKDLNLENIFFEGQQFPEKYYEKASIFLMSSAFEGWGMTIVEAQQKGCVPIVMDTFSAVYDIISDGVNGMIVPADDMISFVASIRTLMLDKKKRFNIACNAINSTSRFKIESIGSEWEKLYRSLL